MVHVPEIALEVGFRHGLYDSRGVGTERTGHVLHPCHHALQTRRVHIAGITLSPNATWIRQVCRNLTDCEDGFLRNASHQIVDCDSSSIPMRHFLDQNTETEIILLPPMTPNMNAYMERWFRSQD